MKITKADIAQKLKRLGKVTSKVIKKAICIFDDIPFLLTLKETGNIGPLLLVGAGLIIFPILAYESVKKLRKTLKQDKKNINRKAFIAASIAKLGLAVIGFAASVCLLAFIITNLALLAAIASIAIPTVMAIVGGIELAQDIHALHLAKKNGDTSEISEAKRDLGYGSVFFVFGVAIATLATLSVLSGLSIVSLGIVPAAILVAVVATALIIKIYQIADTKKIKDEDGCTIEIKHPISEWFNKSFTTLRSAFNPESNSCSMVKNTSTRKAFNTLGVSSCDVDFDEIAVTGTVADAEILYEGGTIAMKPRGLYP